MTINVPYLGVIDMPIKTYTNTYVSPGGGNWNFDQRFGQAMVPQDAWNYRDANGYWLGLSGKFLTRDHQTSYTIGNPAGGTFSGSQIGSVTFNPFTNDWIVNTASQNFTKPTGASPDPNGFSFNAPLNGQTVNIPNPVLTDFHVVQNIANSSCPWPLWGMGGLVQGPAGYGAMFSFSDGLDKRPSVQYPGSVADIWNTSQDAGVSVFIPTSTQGINELWLYQDSPADIFYAKGDFRSSTLSWQQVVFANPVSSTLDFNVWAKDRFSRTWFSSTFGSVKVATDTQTIDGVTYTGYGMFVLPNMAGWYLLKIRGTDADTNDWATNPSAGRRWVMIDWQGNLWLKHNNFTNFVAISGSAISFPGTRPYFSEIKSVSYKDWNSISGQNYNSYFETYQNLPDLSVKGNTPYIYTFMADDQNNPQGAFLTAKWDWNDTGLRTQMGEQVYNQIAGHLLSVKKTRIHGKGRAITIRYDNDAQKNFNIKGWVIFYETNAEQ